MVWENCKPVFADIEPDYLCLDPVKVEKSITDKTTAILATHVYGNPCAVEALDKIAKKHKLKIIYDAAHAFGVKYKNKSILNYGDISTLSFHATKLFHTAEGGAIITDDDELAHEINYLRKFGHNGEEEFWGLGINGKNSELHAAMGLCVLPQITNIIETRKQLHSYYDELLKDRNITKPSLREYTDYNYSYYPIIFESESKLKEIKERMNKKNIFPRRYFYPSLNKLNYVAASEQQISEDISSRVMCLPLFDSLNEEDIANVCSEIH